METGLRKLGPIRLARACEALEAAGILPDIVVETDAQAIAAWENPVLQLCLRYGVGFHPPLDTVIPEVLPPPCEDLFRIVVERPASIDRRAPYWVQQLALTLPEHFLLPYLGEVRGRYGSALVGADLACGWGRVCLSLRDYEGLTVHACDQSRVALRVLARLARRAGLAEHVRPCRTDITALPFADGSLHFVTAFDILEHLTDPTLDRVLGEILRCAAPGAVFYGEIPLHSKCPVITHLQDFEFTSLVRRLEGLRVHGRRFELVHTHPVMLNHFTFAVRDA
jgi:SAM-dependent methyltransferase